MIRVVILLSIFTTSLPTVCCGQDGFWEVADHTVTSRSDWGIMPNAETPLAFDAALLPHDYSALIDSRELDSVQWWDRDGFVVRGQDADDPSSSSGGQSSGDGGGDLTSKANDPTAALISFNVQNFFTTDSYEATGHGYNLNLLPVIPIQKSMFGFDRFITRPSIPIYGPSVDPVGPVDAASGLGDIFVTNLFVKEECWGTWGFGPSINFPTATDPALGSREWQIAPSAVVIRPSADKKWLIGGLVIAPFSLQSEAKSISFQPIVVRFLPNDWYVGNGFQVWNWQTNTGNFAMPLTFKVGRVFKQAKPYPLNISMQAGYTPEDWHQGPAAKWQFLFTVTALIP